MGLQHAADWMVVPVMAGPVDDKCPGGQLQAEREEEEHSPATAHLAGHNVISQVVRVNHASDREGNDMRPSILLVILRQTTRVVLNGDICHGKDGAYPATLSRTASHQANWENYSLTMLLWWHMCRCKLFSKPHTLLLERP